MPVLSALFAFLAGSFRSRTALQIEILAVRHQLNMLFRETTTIEAHRSLALGLAVPLLAGMAVDVGDGQSRHGYWLEPPKCV